MIRSFAWNNFKQSLGTKDQKVVLWTQGILATILLILTLTTSSIQIYLEKNLENLLGADVVVGSNRFLSSADQEFLKNHSQRYSETIQVVVSLAHDGKWQRTALKLVDDGYPVQGDVRVSDRLGGPIRSMKQAPDVGEIWIDGRLSSRLGLVKGEIVHIGDKALTVSAILEHEPDRLMEGHSVEVRAIINQQSLNFAQFLNEKSVYRYLLAASPLQGEQITTWAKQQDNDLVITDRHNGSHPLKAYWKRVENFFGLTFVLLFFMASIAINLASKPKLEATQYRLSLYKSMGLSGTKGLSMALAEWSLTFIVTLLPAFLAALLIHSLVQGELTNHFEGIEATIAYGAVFKTMGLLALMFLFMQVPMFIQLSKASILSLIREEQTPADILSKLVWNGISLTVLAVLYSDNWLLTAMIIGSMVAILLLLLFFTWCVFTLGNIWGKKRPGLLSFVLFLLKQRLFVKATQVIGLGLSLTLLLISLGLMQDLKSSMNSQVRTSNGNLVISDLAHKDLSDFQKWAQNTKSEILGLQPFLHASVIRVNGQSLDDFATQPSDTLARLKRPIRLSWSEHVPANNRQIDGQWWQPEDKEWRQVSVEAEVMTDFGLSFGDRLTLSINGKREEFKIVSSHAFKSGGSSVTFWFQMPLMARQYIDADTHYMGGAELSDEGWSKMGAFLSRTPNLHVVTLRELTERLDATFDLVSKATSGFSLVILLLAVLVIIASVSGFESEDKKRNGLILSMGMTKATCLKMTIYEWVLTASIASFGAVIGTWGMGVLIYEDQFALAYEPNFVLYAAVMAVVLIAVTLLGVYFTRAAMNISIRQILNET
ncbi:hypothetical protein QGN29_09400 [Temperatibacter marinus]|uniref:ABC3 transporter permease C-terminal domain-containing protein n=1 Tax=Temperatibacter marinus TaxID=1456591 RepID=A0AA52EDP6_9PROT|nr:FtsX-like permease family protein [Temperatibacter marinus]WND01768.1 hypothetical protein QGN29_09400 [Temperatibacter marinus]